MCVNDCGVCGKKYEKCWEGVEGREFHREGLDVVHGNVQGSGSCSWVSMRRRMYCSLFAR